MANEQTTSSAPHIRIGSQWLDSTDGELHNETLGEVALNERTGEIEIVSGDRERLARLLASMYHDRFKDETELYHSLTARLNNGYSWAHEVTPQQGNSTQ